MRAANGKEAAARPGAPEELVLGIDTGGTYTDAVLLDYASRRVLSTCKSLTTRRDLSLGIERVVAGIGIPHPDQVKLVSISTTLATNTIAEGKGRAAALFLIGYDPELIETFHLEKQFATPHYRFIGGGHNHFGHEREPLDRSALLAAVDAVRGEVDALAVSAYFSPLNPAHEKEAFAAISAACDLPVVLGHQLSTKLNSIERATTAALNASLLSVLQEFFAAVRQALARRQIEAPLMVVRGDGAMIHARIAAASPVETIHSGPAASAIGGRFLSRLDDALVIDIGGTTTDLALVQAGRVAVSETGATVGAYQTAVRAANLLSIALGGDSHLTQDRHGQISLGPERVEPLAQLARRHPPVRRQLAAVSPRHNQDSPAWLEYWFLLRDPSSGQNGLGARERALVALLRDGPRPLPDILQQLGLFHRNQLHMEPLWRREIIGRAGLTPTDLLHTDGRFLAWDEEGAARAVDAFCSFLGATPGALRRRVDELITERIVRAAVSFLSGRSLPAEAGNPSGESSGRWFFENSLYRKHPLLETTIRLRLPIIGIGAPASVFLPAVAEALHTRLVLPPHHEVANAVGAVAASVMMDTEVLIYPRLSPEGLDVLGYYLQAGDDVELWATREKALGRARELCRQRALEAALRAGAADPEVIVEEDEAGLDSYRVRARAFGNPRLAPAAQGDN